MPTYGYKTGREGSATVASATLYITKWDATYACSYSDSTSSASYASGALWTTQEPGTTSIEGSVEGWFDFGSGTSTTPIIAAVGAGPVATVLKYDASNIFCSGNFNFMNFKSGVEVKEGSPTIGFTADIKSYGPCSVI